MTSFRGQSLMHDPSSSSSSSSKRRHTVLLEDRQRDLNSVHCSSEDMAEKKAVLLNFWGVAVSSRPHAVFHKMEELHNLPG